MPQTKRETVTAVSIEPRNYFGLSRSLRWAAAFVISLIAIWGTDIQADEVDVWIGSSQAGIYHFTLDTKTGKLSSPTIVSDSTGAGFLALHPNGNVLYATDRVAGGSVAAFAIGDSDQGNPAGRKTLRLLSKLPTGDGGAACVAIDPTGRVLTSAHYGGGSVSSYLVNPDGDLNQRVEVIEHGVGAGVVGKRQDNAHPHWVGTSPDNRFLMVPDLGLDRVVVYALDHASAELKLHAKIEVPPGSGPRHMKFHPNGKYAYVLNELSLTVSVFEYGAEDASFKNIQLIETLSPEDKDRFLNSAAEIRVHPSGKFVYSSNRGHDSISVFSVDPSTGKLRFVEHEAIRGACPRNFNLDPSGKWLIAAGQHSNTLALFEIDQTTGKLTFARKSLNVQAPICVLFGKDE
ncbi:MAG: 6-phosphogluconolactonase [Mariniblastus sp.]|jgi:6-phosphogluconolactonase